MADPVTLEPCPHCRGTDVCVPMTRPTYVRCQDCLATGPVKDKPTEAIIAWNRRSSNEALVKALEWPYPNFTLDDIDERVLANDEISPALTEAILAATRIARTALHGAKER